MGMLGLGFQELVIILVIVMVIFGGSKLPELGKGMGSFLKNFKKATSEPEEIDVSADKEAKDSAKKQK
jgi:sec-independent protein translocase protein TatA